MREILRFSVALPLLLLLAAGSCLASDAVDDLITKEMSRRKIPGVSVAVLREGRVAKMQGYGVATIERGERVEPETLFEIGSITKQFKAALIMMLVEEAKLRLDDRITQYFPGTPDEWKSITIRHLLTHTSGIPNYTTLEGFEVSRHLTSEQFVRALAAHPLRFTPGAKFAYCNSGYNLLGFIIEK